MRLYLRFRKQARRVYVAIHSAKVLYKLYRRHAKTSYVFGKKAISSESKEKPAEAPGDNNLLKALSNNFEAMKNEIFDANVAQE